MKLSEMEVVEFAGNDVLFKGKVFQAGNYPDKGIDLTEQDLKDAAATFTPVNNDIEHRPSILSGKIGQLTSVTAKAKELMGTVKLPRWLYDVTGKQISVSLSWDKITKRIVGCALTVNPYITDAQLTAAFSADPVNAGTKAEADRMNDLLRMSGVNVDTAEFATKRNPDYVKLCDEYKKVLWGKSLPVAASTAEKEILGEELTIEKRFNLIATNPAFESIRVELMSGHALDYQTPVELDTPVEMSNTANFGQGTGESFWKDLRREAHRQVRMKHLLKLSGVQS